MRKGQSASDELGSTCGSCGASVRQTDRFCSTCGVATAFVEAGRLHSSSAPADSKTDLRAILAAQAVTDPFDRDYERKFVSILFVDVVGSTSLIDGLDPEDAWDKLAPALKLMRRTVSRYGGTFCKEQGDGAMALFGAPDADDDHALHACLAAVDIIESTGRLTRLSTRAGIHSGEVMVRPVVTDYSVVYDAAGPAVHLASRLESLARPGTVVISAQTQALVGAHFSFSAARLETIRGVAAPVTVFDLLSRIRISRWLARASHGISAFVGRNAELAALRSIVEEVEASHGATVTLVGGAGVGKSRLAHEFLSMVDSTRWTIIELECESIDQTTSYSMLKNLVLAVLRIDLLVDTLPAQAELEAFVARRANAPPFVTSALRSIVGLPVDDPEWHDCEPLFRRRRVVDAVQYVVEAAVEAAPTIVLIEDLHWIDSESATVLNEVTSALTRHQVLFLWTTRPDRRSISTKEIALPDLDEIAQAKLLDDLLGTDATLGQLRKRIVEKAGGVPLYVEEVVRRLVDTNALTGRRGAYRLAVDVQAIGIPSSLQAIIAARIDRLDPKTKKTLQNAAVLGDRVTVSLLSAMAELVEGELQEQLQRLDIAALLVARDGRDAQLLVFPHDLIREVAYGALVRNHRRASHARALGAYRSVMPDRGDEYPEVLLRHAREAQDWLEAVKLGRIAGTRALDQSAYSDAKTFFESAIDSLTHISRTKETTEISIDLKLQLRTVFSATSEIEKCKEYALQAEEMADALGDWRRKSTAMLFKAAALIFMATPAESIGICRQILADQRTARIEPIRVLAEYSLGQAFYAAGQFALAAEVLAELCRRLRDQHALTRFGTPGTTRVMSLSMLAVAKASLGDFDEARAHVLDAENTSDRTARVYDRIAAGYAKGVTTLYQGRSGEAAVILGATLALCEKNEINIFVPVVGGQLGLALVGTGRPREAKFLLERIVREADRLRQDAAASAARAYLAQALAGLGALPEARDLAKTVETAARAKGHRGVELMAMRATCAIDLVDDPAASNRAYRAIVTLLELAETLGSKPTLALGYSMMASSCLRRGNVEEAAAAQSKADELLRAFETTGSKPGAAGTVAETEET